ncbi:MAG: S8 family serine peptidase [Pseudomonadota bacterium]
MRPQVAPARTFDPALSRLVVRGRIELRLKDEESFGDIPSWRDVASGQAVASGRIDGGRVDRTIARFSPAMRASRTFSSAAGRPGRAHEGWSELERSLGLADTLRLDLDPDISLLNLVDALAELDLVVSVTPHYLCQAPFAAPPPPSASPGDPSVFERVGAARALAMEPGDDALIVAIVDSGVALRHPELVGALRPGADTVDLNDVRLTRGLRLMGDTQGRDREPDDDMGHGTGCASIIAARGLRVHAGLAGAARLLPMRALARAQKVDGREPTAVGALPDIDAAVKLAVDLGARVLNLSFGTPASALRPTDPVPHKAVVRYAHEHGCVLVAASGNSGDDTVYYPAALPEVIAVGAVDAADRPSRFSTRGPHVALCAPGEAIPCAGVEGYQENTGTSFAAPFVTAAAALVVARANRQSQPVTPADVRALLTAGASSVPAAADVRGSGAGVLDIPLTLKLVDAASRGPPGEGLSSPSQARLHPRPAL